MKKVVFSILVDNKPGTLAHVVNLFSRRGYNIDSLTVGETNNKGISRITVAVSGDRIILEQIEKQLGKLFNVRGIVKLEDGESVCRELVLLKVAVSAEQRQAVAAISDIFRAKIVDVSVDSLMIELTGTQTKIDAFVKLLEGYEILELVRTGITGLVRGSGDISDYID